MLTAIYRSTIAVLVLGFILCGIYPLVVFGLGNLLYLDNASGGLITRDGKVIGARLIGQSFAKPEYFHGRPSAAGAAGYDAASSSGSNLGPTNPQLADSVKNNIEKALIENPTLKKGEIPTDLVTASGSGLDPHISPAAAFAQVDRVAKARKLTATELRSLIQRHIESPQWGIFGEPVVNVLLLNLELDRLAPQPRQSPQRQESHGWR